MNNNSLVASIATVITYNGWSNRETWLANLWLGGDESYYEQLCHIMSSYGELYDQAEALEEWFRAESDVDYTSVWADFINLALDRVNWYEIVEKNQE